MAKTNDTRQGWLLELKVGSDVFVEGPIGQFTLMVVSAISPGGRITVKYQDSEDSRSYVFTPDGSPYGHSDWRGLQEVTEDRLLEIEVSNLTRNAHSTAMDIEEKIRIIKNLRWQHRFQVKTTKAHKVQMEKILKDLENVLREADSLAKSLDKKK